MNELAERLARGWVRLYTLGLHPDARANRRAEIESDLWEHRHDAAATGSPGLAAAVLRRVLAGMPHDLLWSVEARGSAPGVAIGLPWRSQRGLQNAIVWGTAFFAVALALIDSSGMPILAFMVLGVAGVLIAAGLLRAVLGSPGGAGSGSSEEDHQMGVETYRGRRVRLLVVLVASVAIVLAMWAYAVSLDHWGGARTVVFTVGGLLFPVIALGSLVLLIADLLRMRRG